MKKKIILGVITLLAATNLSYAKGSFTDVPSDYWASSYINTTSQLGIINGFGDGTFLPTNPVTKEQALTMIYRAMKSAGRLKSSEDFTEEYIDAMVEHHIGEWAYPYVAYALKQNIIAIEELSTFIEGKTGCPSNRQEVAVWASKALDKSASTAYHLPYGDVHRVAEDNLPYMDMMYRHGIMMGDENNLFRPDSTITRAEFAAVCSRVYDVGTLVEPDILKEGSTISGVIKDIRDNVIEVVNETGQEISLIISPNAGIIVNGYKSTLADLKASTEGIIAFNSAIDKENIIIWTEEKICEGFIDEIQYLNKAYYKISIQNNQGEKISYLMDEASQVLEKNGHEISLSDLTLNQNILYTCDGIKILEIQIQN